MDATPVVIRRLGADDGETLRSLRLKALTDSPRAFLGDLDEEAARPLEQWRGAAAGGVWFAAFVDGVPAGLVAAVFDLASRQHYVESMWVLPQLRGRGVATALLRAVEHYVLGQGGAAVRLWVLNGNRSAANTYLHYGFRPTELRQQIAGHPGVSEDEFVLWLQPRRETLDQSTIRGITTPDLTPDKGSVTGRRTSFRMP
jgi:GNAT superfamily N-acetyltransferase